MRYYNNRVNLFDRFSAINSTKTVLLFEYENNNILMNTAEKVSSCSTL